MSNQALPTPMMNEKILGYIDRGETEKLGQAATGYTRTQIREDAFTWNFLPLGKATNDMLDRALDERLQIIEDLEPDSAGAKWIPLQTVPDGEYMFGSRYLIPFARVNTRKHVKDVDELRTYRYPLKKVFTHNSIKDAQAEIDGKFIATLKSIVQDTAGGVPGKQNTTGKVQWRGMSGGLTKENFVEALKMLPRGSEDHTGKFRLRNYIALMNDVTAQDWKKLDHNQIGAKVEKMFDEGLTQDVFMGQKTVFTIKDDLVGDNEVWFLPAPEFLGKAYYLNDWTTYVKLESHFIETYSSWLGGFAIGNIAGVCLADFDYS